MARPLSTGSASELTILTCCISEQQCCMEIDSVSRFTGFRCGKIESLSSVMMNCFFILLFFSFYCADFLLTLHHRVKKKKTSVRFKISICSSQCNYSMKRQQFSRLVRFAQNTDVHMSGKTVKLHDWPKMGRQLLVQWRTSYLLSYQDYRHLPAAARLLHRDQRISPILPVNRKHHQIQ